MNLINKNNRLSARRPLITNQFNSFGIPDLDLGVAQADCEIATIWSPAEARDGPNFFIYCDQFWSGGGGGIPEVHRGPKTDRYNVSVTPVKHIRVVIVQQTRSIEYPHSTLLITAEHWSDIWANKQMIHFLFHETDRSMKSL